ncbi:MAG: TonB-dependent receptor [Bacteroidetes bacterium]|nr:TonB-dependent receptor [Bacteroidota bacterium]
MKNRMGLLVLLLSFVFTSNVFAEKETGKIAGKVLGNDNQPLSFANVLLYSATDSSLVKAEYTSEDGSFELANIAAGSYRLNVSFVGLPDYNSSVFELTTGQAMLLPDIRLASKGVELSEVTVTASKPIVEVHPDKTVFNVEGSINATGSDAMELLRKAPGVVVDNNDNIIISGKNGVQVYIDGKPSHLSTSDLAAYLRTIQASDIATIEIITNPSAKWDAEGNAGIINIRMKKDRRLGSNGTLNLGYTRGEFDNYNVGLSGNHRNKTLNTFGSYNFSDGKGFNFFDLYREQNNLAYDQVSPNQNEHQSHNYKLGTDLFINEKNTLGFLVNGYQSDYTWTSDSRMFISPIGQTAPDSTLIANGTNDGMRSNYNFNLNYRFDNSKGVVWNIDTDYGFFKNESDNLNPNRMLTDDGGEDSELLNEETFHTVAPTDIDIYTAKVDHERPFLKGQLSTGVKYSNVQTDNDFRFFNVINGEDVVDVDRTNHFVYTENVNAAYGNYSRQFGKIGMQAGLRVEQTTSEGDLTALKPVNDQNVKREYLDFFPSGGLTWQMNEKNMWQLTYSRRIDRPSYQDLNPFEGRLDKLTFEKGNPFLNPQYTNSVQLTHTFMYMFNTRLNYSHTTDLITQLTDIDERDPNASFITSENLAEQNNLSLNFSAPITVNKWLSFYTNLSGYRTHNEADFGDGKLVDLTIYAYNFYAQSTVNLPKGIVAEVSGWYSSPSVWGGTFETKKMWSMDAGLQKKFLKDKMTIKLSMSDLFKTNKWTAESFFGTLYMRGGGGWDSRRFRANLTYNFGNQEVKSARDRTTGLEDEKNRVKSK